MVTVNQTILRNLIIILENFQMKNKLHNFPTPSIYEGCDGKQCRHLFYIFNNCFVIPFE